MQMDCNLNTKEAVSGSELIKVCDADSGTYRNITPELIKKYINSGSENTGDVTGAYFQDGHLFLRLADGSVSDIGPAQVIYDGNVVESVDGLSNISLSYDNGKLSIQSLVTIDDDQAQSIETGAFIKSSKSSRNDSLLIDVDTAYEQWKIEESAAILLDVVTIDSIDQCGVEYLIDFKQSEVASVSFHLYPITGDGAHIKIKPVNMSPKSKPIYVFGNWPDGTEFSYNIVHSTVFSIYNREWRIEESTQLLSVEKSDLRSDENIKRPVHAIAFDPDSPLTYQITEDGVLIVGVAAGGPISGDYLPLAGGTITGNLKIEPQEGGRGFQIVRVDGSGLLDVNTGNQSNSIRYFKTLEEYDNETSLTEIVNRLYAYAHFLAKDRPWVKTDISVFDGNLYHTGSEFFLNSDYFYIKTGATISTGDIAFDDESMTWTGDIVDFGVMRSDHIEFEKLAVKDFYAYDSDGNTMIHSNPDAKATSFNNFVEFKQAVTYKGPTENEFNLINRKALSEALSGGLAYSGQGEAIPNRRLVSTGSLLQEKVSDQFTNNQNTQEEFQINLDEGLSGAVTYINGGNIPSRRFTVRDNKTSRTSSRTIRAGESWVCHSYLPGDFNTTNFEWFRLDIGTSAQFVASDWLGAQRYAVVSDNVTCFKPNNHFEIQTNGGSALRISFSGDLEYGELRLKCTKGANDYKFVTVIAMNGKQSDFKLYPDYDYHIKVSAKENVDIEFVKTSNSLVAATFDDIDVSGFDAEPHVKPLIKHFSNTDLITIPLSLPSGFSVMVRQVLIRRSSGVELDMGFTYRHQGDTLQVHLNEVGTGFLLAGIIKDEI